MSQRKGHHKIIGEDGSGIFVIQSKLGKRKKASYVYTLQHFDEAMNLIKEADISFFAKEEVLKYKFIVQLEEQLYVFLSSRNNDSGEEMLFAREIDTESLQPTGRLIEVAAVLNERNDGYFTHALSADRSKLLITYASASNRQDRQEFDLFVFDAGLQQLWVKNACLPYADKLFRTEEYKIDNYGNVYLLSVLFEDKRITKRNGKPNYNYHLLSYKKAGEAVEEYAIRLPDKFLTDMQIVVNDRQDVIGGGFYAGQGSYDIEGSYFFTIDGRSNEVVSNSVKKFDKGFITPAMPVAHPDAKASRTPGNIRQNGFSLKDMVLRDDGSAVLVGEQFLVSSSTDMKRNLLGARTQTSYYYDYTDIILVNASVSGKISWTEKISKIQHSHDDAGRYSSYYLNLLQDAMYFVYNEAPNPHHGEEGKDCPNGAEAMMVKVDTEGRQNRQKIEGLDGVDLRLMPRTGAQAGETDLIFLASGKRNNRLIKMYIEPDNILSTKNE